MSACEGNASACLQTTSALEDSAATSSTLEPPDSDRNLPTVFNDLTIGVSAIDEVKPLASVSMPGSSSSSTPIHCHRPSDKPHSSESSGFGHAPVSYGSRFMRHPTLQAPASMESHSFFDTFSSVPPSPSMSEGLTDSPSSVSSMSSFRRGDLADIEDLDLEPELETVSECDEEASSLCSTDVVGDMDSDSERASSSGPDSELGASSNLGRTGTLKALASGSPASDYARRKRSEWYLNSYANKIAYRRPRKPKVSRVSEIVEEGGGDIKTTVMPRPAFAAAFGQVEWSSEVVGPPPCAPRSVSPSDTVPAVSSPLCVCISADAAQGDRDGTAGMDDSVETVKALQLGSNLEGTADETMDCVRADPASIPDGPSDAATLSPPDSPPRASRPRRDSSPARLRPCFRRRSSTQSAASTRESSCDRESVRGRSVRFSPAPPMEMRTHSPVEYDRKSCPINNRLSPEDVEELRTMKMEMGLLEAKWAADAACKAPAHEDESEAHHADGALSDAAHNAGVAALSAASHRNSNGTSEATLGLAHMTPAARLRLQKERDREKERQKHMPRARISTVRPQYDCDSVRAKFGQAPPPPLPGLPQSPGRSGVCQSTAPSAFPSPRSSSAPPIAQTPSEERSFQSRLTGTPVLKHRPESTIPTLTQTAPSPPASPMDMLQAGSDGKGSGAWHRPVVARAGVSGSLVVDGGHGGGDARGRSPGSAALLYAASRSPSSSRLRSTNLSSSWTTPSSSPSPAPPSFPAPSSLGGYDSPLSCEYYESGSEYDLVA